MQCGVERKQDIVERRIPADENRRRVLCPPATSPSLTVVGRSSTITPTAVSAPMAPGTGRAPPPLPDMLDGDLVHGQMTEGGQDEFAHDAGAVRQGARFPVPGLAFEELGGEGVHRMARRAGAAIVPDRFGEGGDEPAGLGARLGDGHGADVADGGVTRLAAHLSVVTNFHSASNA